MFPGHCAVMAGASSLATQLPQPLTPKSPPQPALGASRHRRLSSLPSGFHASLPASVPRFRPPALRFRPPAALPASRPLLPASVWRFRLLTPSFRFSMVRGLRFSRPGACSEWNAGSGSGRGAGRRGGVGGSGLRGGPPGGQPRGVRPRLSVLRAAACPLVGSVGCGIPGPTLQPF